MEVSIRFIARKDGEGGGMSIEKLHQRHSPIEDAYLRNLPICPKSTCAAWPGDPCRTPNGKTTKAHKERERLLAEADTGRANERKSKNAATAHSRRSNERWMMNDFQKSMSIFFNEWGGTPDFQAEHDELYFFGVDVDELPFGSTYGDMMLLNKLFDLGWQLTEDGTGFVSYRWGGESLAPALKTNGELCDSNAELRRDVITKWEPLLAAVKARFGTTITPNDFSATQEERTLAMCIAAFREKT